MPIDSMLWLIPALPFVGFLINGLFGKRLPNPVVAAIAVAGPLVAFVIAVVALLNVHDGHGPARVFYEWMAAGNLSIPFGLQVDALTGVMLMNVTGIGTAITLYSYGYMHEDPGFARFMAYLNLFLSAMLILVMGDNLLVLFVGWEGVGLCSYLLIGFWYDDFANVDAGRKAFVVNRIGDFAFLVGAFTLYSLCGAFDWHHMEEAISAMNLSAVVPSGPLAGWTYGGALTLAGLCLFGGATGKSAQLPLYVWLPDAMAGPTPVSALIHAATMVTAGVYLIGRMDFLYVLLPDVTAVIALVAALTALLSGTIAVAQNDIKKVLAYSTVSQLGFMFAGMASTFWTSGLFHVVTHAFFKALLFLGAGAVIHAMHHEQDIRKMGGLWKDLRLVAVLFIIGSIALAGVPPFAGFFSKDEILGSVWFQASHNGGVWVAVLVILMVTAALTAFYTTRLVVITFFGEPADHHRHLHHVHWSMIVPLVLLAILSVFGGLLATPLETFTHHVWSHAAWIEEAGEESLHHAHTLAMAFSVGAVIVGVGAGAFVYGTQRKALSSFVEGPGHALHNVVLNKFYVDELYDLLVVRPIRAGATMLWSGVDRNVIDSGVVEGTGNAVMDAGITLRRTQLGAVSVATTATLLGTIVILMWLVLSA